MDIDNILAVVLATVPSIMSIVSAVGVLLNVLKNYNEIKQELHNRNDYEELKSKLNTISEENIKLKQAIFELVEYSKKHPLIKSKEE